MEDNNEHIALKAIAAKRPLTFPLWCSGVAENTWTFSFNSQVCPPLLITQLYFQSTPPKFHFRTFQSFPVAMHPPDSDISQTLCLWILLYHVWMINDVCHTAGAALNPAGRVALTLRLQEGRLMRSKWKADGNKDGRSGRRRSDATPFNKVTGGKRKEQRQPGWRYEEERRSDSLKRYKGVFDFPLPGAISAVQNNLSGGELRWAPIMISDPPCARTGRQVEMEARQAQSGWKWSHSGLKRGAFLHNAHAVFRTVAGRSGILGFNGV